MNRNSHSTGLHQRANDCLHALSLIDIRQAPKAGAEVVDCMLRVRRFGQHTVNGRVSQDVLQRELCPRVAIELGGPFGKFLVTNETKILAIDERPVDDYGGACL